ncbi:MAG TPA: SPOR domain-containing protein [Alloacidobacterium sp.]|nr:SPOR domain-containing protein [Alloacidobacterium sp.]
MRSVIDDEEEKTDSEVTLNATTLLGIFFGLVLVCGVFFGFGYSIGRRGTDASSTTPPAATTSADDTATPAASHTPKPSAMESLQAAGSTDANDNADTVTESTDTANSQTPTAAPVVKQAALSSTPLPKPSAVTAAPPQIKPASLPIPSQTASGNAAGIMVQIAAVTHQEDANVLVSALRQRGYSVSVRNEPQDKLLHVQVGPFTSRDSAKAMRSRLLADGYNAILKQ